MARGNVEGEERRTEPASQLLAPWACISRTREAQKGETTSANRTKSISLLSRDRLLPVCIFLMLRDH
jgi:hypothetical protein